MGAEQRGRHRADVAPGSREHGDGYAQRALAVPAHIVHGRDARNVAPFAMVEGCGAGDSVRHGYPSFSRGLMDQRQCLPYPVWPERASEPTVLTCPQPSTSHAPRRWAAPCAPALNGRWARLCGEPAPNGRSGLAASNGICQDGSQEAQAAHAAAPGVTPLSRQNPSDPSPPDRRGRSRFRATAARDGAHRGCPRSRPARCQSGR